MDNQILKRSCVIYNNKEYESFNFLGFSVFGHTEIILTGGGRGMSAVGKPIEWDYKDLKTQWKYLDYKNNL